MKQNKKRRSSTLRIKSISHNDRPRYINPKNNELSWLDELNNYNATKIMDNKVSYDFQEQRQEETRPIEVLPHAFPEETGTKEQEQVLEDRMRYTDSVQLVARIPKSIVENLHQKKLNVTRIFQESLITAILLAQDQDIFEELKVEIMVDSHL